MNTKPHWTIEPAEVYHAHAAISRGKLTTFRKRRREYHRQFVLAVESDIEPNDAMNIGTIGHAVLLEGKTISESVVVIPADVLAKNGARSGNAWKDFAAEHAGKVLLKAEQVAEATASVEAVLAHPFIRKWLGRDRDCLKEHSVYWPEKSDRECRCRPDWWFPLLGDNIVFDFKFTADASPKAFTRRINDGEYWLQDAHYSAGIQSVTGYPVSFFFIAVDVGLNPAVGIYNLDPTTRADANEDRKKTLSDIAYCERENDWREPWEKQVETIELYPRS